MYIARGIRRWPIGAYFAVTFLISWSGFLAVGGPGLIARTHWQSDPRFMIAVMLMLAGPPIAGIALTLIVFGKAGIGDLRGRLVRWRVGPRWYIAALLIAPLAQLAVLLVLSQRSSTFLPAIVAASDKASLLVAGVAVGLLGGLVEELGWTGFAVPRMRARHGVFFTGVIVGMLWGAWHLLQMLWVGSTSYDTVPPMVFMPIYIVSSVVTLTAYRILMVWVYDHTKSLLVAVLMHASYIFSTLFVFAPPTTDIPFLIYSVVFAAALWIVAGTIFARDRGFLAHRRLRGQFA